MIIILFSLQLLEDQYLVVRLDATKAFAKMGSQATPAIPALIQLLDDQNSTVRSNAGKSLREIGAESKPAVPALIQL